MQERLEQQHAESMARITELKAQVAELRERLGMNSSNSHKPPASDSPKDQAKKKNKRKKKKNKRRSRASGKGKGGHQRAMVPVEEVDHFHPCKPTNCACCGLPLDGEDPQPQRHQVTELPEKLYEVHEYQLHSLACSDCGHETRASLPEGVSKSHFGPCLKAFMVLLTGVFAISRRKAQALLSEMGIDVAVGSISKAEGQATVALQAPVEAVAEVARAARVANVDETSWKTKGERRWLWVLCFSTGALFLVQKRRNTDAAQTLLGKEFDGVVGCDRWGAYNWVEDERKQLCWAHLDRDFLAMADSQNAEAKAVGMALVLASDALFHFWWRVRDGTLEREEFQRIVDENLRPHVHALLFEGSECGHKKTRGVCRHILKREAALWTFVYHEGVEPTNNSAERALRGGVLWRKRSFGSQSKRGERFVERILTMAATLKVQARSTFAYLTELFGNLAKGDSAPPLIPADA